MKEKSATCKEVSREMIDEIAVKAAMLAHSNEFITNSP